MIQTFLVRFKVIYVSLCIRLSVVYSSRYRYDSIDTYCLLCDSAEKNIEFAKIIGDDEVFLGAK